MGANDWIFCHRGLIKSLTKLVKDSHKMKLNNFT